MSTFLDGIDHEAVVKALREAEAGTSGRILVHITHRKVRDARAAAEAHFRRERLDRHAGRNAVLIFVAPASRKLAVVGDRAIHERCGQDHWEEVVALLRDAFRAGRFTEGLVAAIGRLGAALARHFPRAGAAAPPAPR